MGPGIINKYFPALSAVQQEQFILLDDLYKIWNSRINVISRKDIENLYEHHILHSLGIAKIISFKPGTKIMDAGTGGGFPGIPLAILFPEVHFHLVDSTAKKLIVVQAIADETGLKNITVEHNRLENHHGHYDFIVSRAVALLDQMKNWTWKNISKEGFNEKPNGILYLKGGDLTEEIKGMGAWGHGGMEAGKRGRGEEEKGGRGEEGKRGRGEEGKRGRGEEGKRGRGEEGKRGLGDKEMGKTIEQLSNRTVNYVIYPISDYFQEDFFSTKSVVHLF